jgi:hypothetical protein
MKFQNISYEKTDVNIILKLANDFKITIKNEKKETEIIKYEKNTIIGQGVANIEIIQTKPNNEILSYFFFKSFQMDSKINTQHIFYDKNILNDEKIGIYPERLTSLNLAYEIDGKIIDITSEKRDKILANNDGIEKIKKYLKNKLSNTLEIKKDVDKSKKPKDITIETI